MKLIAHRGNLYGPDPLNENKPEYIINSIEKGYDCEIDVRFIDGILYLGHDSPDYIIDLDFLMFYKDQLWIHCKNLQALDYLITIPDLNIFWHQEDDYTLTSKGYIWTFPGKLTTTKSIIVMPEWNEFKIDQNSHGICSDFVDKLKMYLL